MSSVVLDNVDKERHEVRDVSSAKEVLHPVLHEVAHLTLKVHQVFAITAQQLETFQPIYTYTSEVPYSVVSQHYTELMLHHINTLLVNIS